MQALASEIKRRDDQLLEQKHLEEKKHSDENKELKQQVEILLKGM